MRWYSRGGSLVAGILVGYRPAGVRGPAANSLFGMMRPTVVVGVLRGPLLILIVGAVQLVMW
jgi:hypothetical protein